MKSFSAAIALTAAAAFAATPSSAAAHEFSALLKARKFAEAEQAASAKLKLEPNYVPALLTKIEAMTAQGQESRLDEAITLGEHCIKVAPQESKCHEIYGTMLGIKIASGGVLSAISLAGKVRSALQKAVELDSKNHDARLALFTYYVQAPAIAGGGQEKAQAFVQESAKVGKDVAALLQARLDVKGGKLEQAENAVLAIKAGGDDFEELHAGAIAAVGIEYREQKKYAESERVLRALTKLYPHNFGGHLYLGRTLADAGRHQEALNIFQTALQIDELPALHYRIGLSQSAIGEKTKAIASLEKALAQKKRLSKKQREDAETQLKELKKA